MRNGKRYPRSGGRDPQGILYSNKPCFRRIGDFAGRKEGRKEGDKEYLDEVTHKHKPATVEGIKRDSNLERNTKTHKHTSRPATVPKTIRLRWIDQDKKTRTGKEERKTARGKRDRPGGKSTVREYPTEAGIGRLGGETGAPSRAGPTPPWRLAPKGGSPGDRRRVNPECLGCQAWKADPRWK